MSAAEKRGPGRPRKDDDDKASERVQVMLRPSEREVLDVAAKRAGVSLSAYLRRAALREAAE